MVRVREAATVVLVRDRPALEVLLLRRTDRVEFVPGATVFPGGALDPADRGPAAAERTTGLDDSAASRSLNLPAGGLGVWAAAARECFEETGVLLARDAVTGAPPDLADPSRRARLAIARAAINGGEGSFADLLHAEGLVVHAPDLHPFAHWLTPLGAPRRYDTWFLVAAMPPGQEAEHDDHELVHSAWVRPGDALAAGAAGRSLLILPTQRALELVARFETAAELLAALAAVPRDGDGRPPVVPVDTGERVRLPGDPATAPATWTIPLPSVTFAREAALAHAADVARRSAREEAPCPT